MKKLIIALSLLSAPVMAEDLCSQMHTMGEAVMQARQNGLPLPAMLKTLQENDLEDVMKPIVIEAYSRPRYQSKSVQDRTVADFANDLHLACLKHNS